MCLKSFLSFFSRPMYTAESTSKEVKNGALNVTVHFTDGTDSFNQDFLANSGTDPDWLKNRVTGKLNELNTLSEFAKTLTLGRINPVIYTSTEKDAWLNDMALYRQMLTAISLGLMDNTDKDFIAQKDKVVTGFSKDYLAGRF